MSKPSRWMPRVAALVLAAVAYCNTTETLAISPWDPAWDGYGGSSWYDDSWGFGDWFGGDGFNASPWDSWSPWSRRRSRNYGGYWDGWDSPYGRPYGDRYADPYGYRGGDPYRGRYDRGAPWWGDRDRGRDRDYGRYPPPGYFDDYPRGGDRYTRPYEPRSYDRYDDRRGDYDRNPYDRRPRDRYYDTPAQIDRDFKLPPYDEIQPDTGYDSPDEGAWDDSTTEEGDDWSTTPSPEETGSAPPTPYWEQPDSDGEPAYSSPPPVW